MHGGLGREAAGKAFRRAKFAGFQAAGGCEVVMCMAVGSGMPNRVAAFIDVCSTDVRDSSYSYSCGARGHKKLSNSNLRLHHTLVTDDLYKAYTLNPKP